MQCWKMIVGAVLLSLVATGGEAVAGWVVEQTVTGAGDGGRQHILIQANRLKTVMLGQDGRAQQAMILDLAADTITQVDYAERTYLTAGVQEFVQTLGGAAQAAAGQMAEAMKGMQQQLQSLPPEQRRQVEEMMRRQMPQAGGAQACAERKREVRRTGQQATIAGFPAVRYEVLAAGRVESEVWMAPAIGLGREVDVRKLEQFATAMARLGPGCGPGRPGAAGSDPGWRLAGEGYPVRTVDKESGVTIEVVKAESRQVPAAEFQPPAGFARKTLQELMGR